MIFELLMEKFMAQGMSEEDAFTETLSIDCNMDEEDDDKEYVENLGRDSRLWKGDLIW